MIRASKDGNGDILISKGAIALFSIVCILISGVVSITVFGKGMESRVDFSEDRIENMEDSIGILQISVQAQELSLAEIAIILEVIKEDIQEIKEDLKE